MDNKKIKFSNELSNDSGSESPINLQYGQDLSNWDCTQDMIVTQEVFQPAQDLNSSSSTNYSPENPPLQDTEASEDMFPSERLENELYTTRPEELFLKETPCTHPERDIATTLPEIEDIASQFFTQDAEGTQASKRDIASTLPEIEDKASQFFTQDAEGTQASEGDIASTQPEIEDIASQFFTQDAEWIQASEGDIASTQPAGDDIASQFFSEDGKSNQELLQSQWRDFAENFGNECVQKLMASSKTYRPKLYEGERQFALIYSQYLHMYYKKRHPQDEEARNRLKEKVEKIRLMKFVD